MSAAVERPWVRAIIGGPVGEEPPTLVTVTWTLELSVYAWLPHLLLVITRRQTSA